MDKVCLSFKYKDNFVTDFDTRTDTFQT